MKTVGDQDAPAPGGAQIGLRAAGGGKVDETGGNTPLPSGNDLPQAGGVGAEALAEHRVQHPAGWVALHGVQELGAGEIGLQTAGRFQDHGLLIKIEVVVLFQKLQQYVTVCHG